MPNSIRVKLAPLPAVVPTGLAGAPVVVSGFRPDLTLLGADMTKALRDRPKAAKLELFARWIKSVRHEPDMVEESLAVLEGEIRLAGRPGRPVFRCSAESLKKLLEVDTPPESEETATADDPKPDSGVPRALDLKLDSGAFEGLEPLAGAQPQLLLSQDRTRAYRYLKVLGELSVAGSVEASRDRNDVLDVPISRDSPPRARGYEVKVIDEVGEAISGARLTFSHSGKTKDRTTDGQGMAFVLGSSNDSASVTVPEPEAVHPELDQRWRKVRDQPVLPLDAGLVDRMPRELKVPFPVKAGKRETLCVRPPVVMARIKGTLFDKDKCFLLPSAVPSLRKLIDLYQENDVENRAGGGSTGEQPQTEVLIVGHTDTTGEPDYNSNLSAERADSMRAYLLDDCDAWLAWFGSDKPAPKRWGAREEQMMIESLVPAEEIGAKDPTSAYQEWHNAVPADKRPKQGWEALEPDGKMGPKTRKQLVLDYMNHDGTTLAEDVRIVTYGAGEMYPLTGADGDVDQAPADASDEPEDRRVEVFFFAKPFGIRPPVPGVADGASPKKAVRGKSGEREYLEWRKRSVRMFEYLHRIITLRLFLHDERHRLMKETDYELDIDGDVRSGKTGPEGYLIAANVLTPATCRVSWYKTPILEPAMTEYPMRVPEPEFLYGEELNLSFRDDASGQLRREDETRLRNLGYAQAAFDSAWLAFQRDYELPEQKWFDQATHDRLVQVHHDGIEAEPGDQNVPTDGDIEDWENDGPSGPSGPRLRLLDPSGKVMKDARYRLTAGGKTIEATSADGWVPIDAPEGVCAECKVAWGQTVDGGAYPHVCMVAMGCGDEGIPAEDETLGKLNNLGYPSDLGLAECVSRFQTNQGLAEHGLTPEGKVPPATLERVRKVYQDALKEDGAAA